ncbi:MAG: hypothetical protein WBE72_08535 [Terracidiphilus sp.]
MSRLETHARAANGPRESPRPQPVHLPFFHRNQTRIRFMKKIAPLRNLNDKSMTSHSLERAIMSFFARFNPSGLVARRMPFAQRPHRMYSAD